MFKLLEFLKHTLLRDFIYIIPLANYWIFTGWSHLRKLSEPLNNHWLTIKVGWPKGNLKNPGLKERKRYRETEREHVQRLQQQSIAALKIYKKGCKIWLQSCYIVQNNTFSLILSMKHVFFTNTQSHLKGGILFFWLCV